MKPLVITLSVALAIVTTPGCGPMAPETPLSIAAAEGDVDGVRTLLADGADPNERDCHGQTAALWAARRGPPETLRLLLDTGVSIDQRDCRSAFGWTLLVSAIHSGRLETVEALVDWGADVELASDNGLTPLMAAIKVSDLDDASRAVIVERLLAAGADPRFAPEGYQEPLTTAVAGGQLGIVRALLAAHPDLRLQDDGYGSLARTLARLRGDDEILALVGDE